MRGKSVADLAGQRFGRFEVLARADNDRHGNAKWDCLCDCGSARAVLGRSLRSGVTQSCGCMNKEINAANITHGMSATREYKAWAGMVQRCTNPKHHKWPRYGGRGIRVCDRWLSFENFYEDMGHRPPGMTVDRENNDGNYEPTNCRWATAQQQADNKSSNRYVTVNGEQMTVSAASRLAGIQRGTVASRMRSGWTVDRALSEPTQTQR